MTEYFGIEFDEILKRLIGTGHDTECFKAMIKTTKLEENANLEISKYKRMSTKDRMKELKKLAKNCRNNGLYSEFEPNSLILYFIAKVVHLPETALLKIFGKVNQEDEIYPEILRNFLKRESFFKGYRIVQTDKKRRKGVRLADFTLYKRASKSRLTRAFQYRDVVSVEVKAKEAAFGHLRNQGNDFSIFSDKIYMVLTSELLFKLAIKGSSAFKDINLYFYNYFSRIGATVYSMDLVSGKFSKIPTPMLSRLVKDPDNAARKLALSVLEDIEMTTVASVDVKRNQRLPKEEKKRR
jgi:hypothetical protein